MCAVDIIEFGTFIYILLFGFRSLKFAMRKFVPFSESAIVRFNCTEKEFAHMIVDLPKNDFKCFVDAYNRMRKKDNAEDDSVEDVYSNILNGYKLKF